MALVFLLLLNILGCPALRHLSPPVICDLWVCIAIQPAQVRYLFCGYLVEDISRLLTYIIISIFVLFYFATKSFPYWTMAYTYFLIFYFLCVYVLKCEGGHVPWHTRGGQRTASRSRFSSSTVWVSLPPCGSRLKALKLQGLAAGTFSYCIISLALHGLCFFIFFNLEHARKFLRFEGKKQIYKSQYFKQSLWLRTEFKSFSGFISFTACA